MGKEKKSVSFIYKLKEGNVSNPLEYEMIRDKWNTWLKYAEPMSRDKWNTWLKYAEPLLFEEYYEV